MLYTTVKRFYLGVGREYDEVIILFDTHTDKMTILHTGTFADEGFRSTVNLQHKGKH